MIDSSQRCDFPGTQCHGALPDFHPFSHCNGHHRRFVPCFSARAATLPGYAAKSECAKALVKGQHLGPQVATRSIGRTDFRRSAAALRQRPRARPPSARSARIRPGPPPQSRDGRLHALLPIQIERRRAAPRAGFQDLLGVPRAAEPRLDRTRRCRPQQHHRAPGALELIVTGAAVFSTPTMPITGVG